MSPDRPWQIRALPDATEIPSVVVESWLGAYRESPWAGVVPNNVYAAVYSEAIRQLVARGALLFMAVNPANPAHILGYMCCEWTRDQVPVVHFMFVKDLYREWKSELYESLLSAAGIDPTSKFFYTFKTGWEKKFPGGRYSPAIARRKVA